MNMMNGKPCIGAPRCNWGSKNRLPYEPEPEIEAKIDNSPLNLSEMRSIVSRAILRGVIKVETPTPEPKKDKPQTRLASGKINYGEGVCISCGCSFQKIARKSYFCVPCKWGPRPCSVCGTEFVPSSAPKRGVTIKTCGKPCALELMRRAKVGKAPANKGVRRK